MKIEATNGFHFLSLALSKINLEVATSPEGKVMSKPLFLRCVTALFFELILEIFALFVFAKLKGNKTENGRMMFIYQAHQSFALWNKVLPKINEETIDILK